MLVDESPVGTAPLGPVEVTPGEHAVRVRLPGYSEFTDVVTVARGQEVRVAVELFPLAHVVAVESTPSGARVFVGDRFAGETPTEVELLGGSHTLRLRLRGFEDAVRTFEAVAGQRETWAVTLVALPEPGPAQWYEDPMFWVATGAGVLAVAAIVVVVAAAAAPSPSALEQFCAPEGRCIRFDPSF